MAPLYLEADNGVVVFVDSSKALLRTSYAGADQEFRIVSEGRLRIESQANLVAHWFLIDESHMRSNKELSGFDGFCFIGNVNAETELAYGFIPFGETEIMVDADGRRFLIARSEE